MLLQIELCSFNGAVGRMSMCRAVGKDAAGNSKEEGEGYYNCFHFSLVNRSLHSSEQPASEVSVKGAVIMCEMAPEECPAHGPPKPHRPSHLLLRSTFSPSEFPSHQFIAGCSQIMKPLKMQNPSHAFNQTRLSGSTFQASTSACM